MRFKTKSNSERAENDYHVLHVSYQGPVIIIKTKVETQNRAGLEPMSVVKLWRPLF